MSADVLKVRAAGVTRSRVDARSKTRDEVSFIK